MKDSLTPDGYSKITLLLRAVGLKGRQVVEAVKVTTEGLMEDLKSEISKGNHQQVIAFLGTNALLWGKSALLDSLTKRVAARLMLRMGLPGIIAAGVVTILVPFVLLKLRKKAQAKKDAGEVLEIFGTKPNEALQVEVQPLLEEKLSGDEVSLEEKVSAAEVKGAAIAPAPAVKPD